MNHADFGIVSRGDRKIDRTLRTPPGLGAQKCAKVRNFLGEAGEDA